MKKKNHAGFTLAELMAVVIIVALLASISIGYYSKAQEQSYFSEGLSTASAIAAAIERSVEEDRLAGENPTFGPKIDSLDIGITGTRSCSPSSDYCVRTHYFEIKINKDSGIVTAKRTSTKAVAQYKIEIKPNFAGDQIACIGTGTDSDDIKFCQSMGYTNCSGTICTKE